MRCPACGLTNFADRTACRRCGAPLGQSGAAFAATVVAPNAPFRSAGAVRPLATGDVPLPPPGPTANFAPGPIGSVHARAPGSTAMPFTGSVATVMGDTISMPAHGIAFPGVCSKCDATHDLTTRDERVTFTPWHIYLIGVLLLPLGLLPFILTLAIGQRNATLRVPVCPACNARWQQAKIVRAIALVCPIGIGILIANINGTGSTSGPGMVNGLLAFLGSLVVLPLLATFLVVRPATIRATQIDGGRLTVAGFSDAMLRAVERAPDPGELVLQGPVAKSSSWPVVLVLLLVLGLPALAIVATVGVYAVRKSLVAAKTTEARTLVTGIAEHAKSAYDTDGRLCPSASRPIPERMSEITRGRYLSTMDEWQRDASAHAGFACLGVYLDQPQHFQYNYVASTTGFVVTARGDMDADGEYSTFEIEGTIEPGGVQLSPIKESAPGE